MKDFIISLIAAVLLIIAFSVTCYPADIPPPSEGSGTRYPGESGMVLPGDGSEPAEAQATTQPEPMQGKQVFSITSGGSEEASELNENATEAPSVEDIFDAFWCGVAAVIIGAIIAAIVIKIGGRNNE